MFSSWNGNCITGHVSHSQCYKLQTEAHWEREHHTGNATEALLTFLATTIKSNCVLCGYPHYNCFMSVSIYAARYHQSVSNYLSASIIGINLELFSKHLLIQLTYLLLHFFQLLCKLHVFTFQAVDCLLHVSLLSRLLRKDLLITLQVTLALHDNNTMW